MMDFVALKKRLKNVPSEQAKQFVKKDLLNHNNPALKAFFRHFFK